MPGLFPWLRFFKVFAVCAIVLGLLPAVPAGAQTLDEAGFRATVVGTELTGMFGASLVFQPDGTITGGLTGDNAVAGSWRFDGPALCTTIQDGAAPPVGNCGVPQMTKRHLVVDGASGLRLRHDR
jgi:hypothetical protein